MYFLLPRRTPKNIAVAYLKSATTLDRTGCPWLLWMPRSSSLPFCVEMFHAAQRWQSLATLFALICISVLDSAQWGTLLSNLFSPTILFSSSHPWGLKGNLWQVDSYLCVKKKKPKPTLMSEGNQQLANYCRYNEGKETAKERHLR